MCLSKRVVHITGLVSLRLAPIVFGGDLYMDGGDGSGSAVTEGFQLDINGDHFLCLHTNRGKQRKTDDRENENSQGASYGEARKSIHFSLLEE